jgi:hypothetical protein
MTTAIELEDKYLNDTLDVFKQNLGMDEVATESFVDAARADENGEKQFTGFTFTGVDSAEFTIILTEDQELQVESQNSSQQELVVTTNAQLDKLTEEFVENYVALLSNATVAMEQMGQTLLEERK